MVGGGDIDYVPCPKPSSDKEQRDNSIRGMGEENFKTLLLTNLRFFGRKSIYQFPRSESWDQKLWSYAFHSIGYRFLIGKSEVSGMHEIRVEHIYNFK